MVRECENFFSNRSFLETKGTRFAYVFEKYRLFRLSLCKNSSFPFFFLLFSFFKFSWLWRIVSFYFLFYPLLSFVTSLQRLEKNQDGCNTISIERSKNMLITFSSFPFLTLSNNATYSRIVWAFYPIEFSNEISIF